MLYGKTNKRTAVRTYRRTGRKYVTRVPRLVKTTDYVPCVVAYTFLLIDNSNHAVDLMANLLLTSTDWLVVKTMHSAFKVTNVTVDSSPSFVNTAVNSDCANGWVGIREGFYEASPTSLATNELAKFPNVIPVSNLQSFSISRKVVGGSWFNSLTTSTSDSEMPKLTFYASWLNTASTNTQRCSLRCRIYMIAKGSAIQ